jgi:hypothetical protein
MGLGEEMVVARDILGRSVETEANKRNVCRYDIGGLFRNGSKPFAGIPRSLSL